MTDKIVSLETAVQAAANWRAEGLTIVFANGCFDGLHPGHLSLLQFARGHGDILIVAINSDASVRRLKGPMRPVRMENLRAAMLAALRPIDLVLIFDEDTPIAAIEAIRPDVLVKGADYSRIPIAGADFVEARGGRVALAPINVDFSTTAELERFP